LSDVDETRATARLPHLDIELLHRRPRDGGAELIAITVRGVPSLEAFARLLETANPLLWWIRWLEAAWAPWLPPAARPRLGDRETDGYLKTASPEFRHPRRQSAQVRKPANTSRRSGVKKLR
jgi:hypothetical protein